MYSSSQQLNRIKSSQQFKIENPQLSLKNSVLFVKKLTVLTVSNVTFLRQILPDSAFSNRTWEGMKVKILSEFTDIPESKTVCSWLKGVLDTIEAKRLRKLFLVISKQTSGGTQPVEMYTFNYSYENENVYCDIMKESQELNGLSQKMKHGLPDDIKQSTMQLVSSIMTLTTNLLPLPNDSVFNMWIQIAGNGPSEYEIPKDFHQMDSMDVNMPLEARTLKLGKLNMKYGEFALSVKTLMEHESEEQLNEDDVIMPTPEQTEQSIVLAKNIPPKDKTTDEASDLAATISSVNLGNDELSCVCGCSDYFDDIIRCTSCLKYQHKPCYKILADQKVDTVTCVNCHEPNNPLKTCTDPELVTSKNRKSLALYRRALVLCLRAARVSPHLFTAHFNIPRQVALQLYNKLERDGCFLPGPRKSGNICKIDTAYLKNIVMMEKFNKTLNSEEFDSVETDLNQEMTPLKRKRNTEEKTGSQERRESPVQQKMKRNAEEMVSGGTQEIRGSLQKRKRNTEEEEDNIPGADKKRYKCVTAESISCNGSTLH